jgi:hypothetical protein
MRLPVKNKSKGKAGPSYTRPKHFNDDALLPVNHHYRAQRNAGADKRHLKQLYAELLPSYLVAVMTVCALNLAGASPRTCRLTRFWASFDDFAEDVERVDAGTAEARRLYDIDHPGTANDDQAIARFVNKHNAEAPDGDAVAFASWFDIQAHGVPNVHLGRPAAARAGATGKSAQRARFPSKPEELSPKVLKPLYAKFERIFALASVIEPVFARARLENRRPTYEELRTALRQAHIPGLAGLTLMHSLHDLAMFGIIEQPTAAEMGALVRSSDHDKLGGFRGLVQLGLCSPNVRLLPRVCCSVRLTIRADDCRGSGANLCRRRARRSLYACG